WISDTKDAAERERREQSDFLAYRDSEGRHGDFHALRHTYVSLIVRSGASAKVAQELARHSTVQLTLGRYAHPALYDLTAAVNALPSLTSGAEREALAETGTDGAGESFAHSFARDRPIRGISGDDAGRNAAPAGEEKTPENQRESLSFRGSRQA